MRLLDRILHRGPPDVSRMKAARDLRGLMQALTYGARREKRGPDDDYNLIVAQVVAVELGAMLALAELRHVPAIPVIAARIGDGHTWTHLIREAEDPDNAYSLLLARFGEPAIDTLIGMLNLPNPTTVSIAEYALGHIGPAAARAVPRLLEVAGEIEKYAGATQANAFWALQRITDDPAVVPLLITAIRLFSSCPASRRAVLALGSGRYGQAAADAAAKALADPPWMRSQAMLALCLMGDERGREAFLQPCNFASGDGRFLGEKELLAVVGRFDDERVRGQLLKSMEVFVEGSRGTGNAALISLDHAVHCALGLIQMKEPRATEFLREALASGTLTFFSNWVWGESDETLARRALAQVDDAADVDPRAGR